MNSREKLVKALNHESGPVPIDFGSTAVSGMHVSVVEGLRNYYGLEKKPVKVIEPYQMLGEIDSELRRYIGVDVEGLYPRNTMFGFENRNWKDWTTPWGQKVLVPGNFNTVTSDGDILIFPEGDLNSSPSGRMPSGGYFFDAIIRQHPINDGALNPEDNLEEFTLLDEIDWKYYQSEKQRFGQGENGIVASFSGTALGDIALVPAPFMKDPKGIRDISEWYMSTMIRRDYIHEIFSRQVELAIENFRNLHILMGEDIQAVFLCGTDFGTQNSLFCSAETYEELYAPHYRIMTDWIHRYTSWKIFKHSCGAVIELMEHFIESGFDIINPVQISASGMDPEILKSRYGDQIVFWGGGVDTQKVLPFGSEEEVRVQVLKLCEVFAEGGGFVFNTIHNIQAETPVKNVVAMIEAINEFNN